MKARKVIGAVGERNRFLGPGSVLRLLMWELHPNCW
jgi:hypothetical protein